MLKAKIETVATLIASIFWKIENYIYEIVKEGEMNSRSFREREGEFNSNCFIY
jgi:hypothetical protein